jgi:hypothetical protein
LHKQSVLDNGGKVRHMSLVRAEADAAVARVAKDLHLHYRRSATAIVHGPAAAPAQEGLAPRADSVDSDIEGISLNFGEVGRHAINQGDLQSAAFQGTGQAQADERNIEFRRGRILR